MHDRLITKLNTTPIVREGLKRSPIAGQLSESLNRSPASSELKKMFP